MKKDIIKVTKPKLVKKDIKKDKVIFLYEANISFPLRAGVIIKSKDLKDVEAKKLMSESIEESFTESKELIEKFLKKTF